jgi:hypothetical protein|tara:strand:- start:142 stop:903 length:762 start_codon:yes stop_codon:yes gene_type:complete
MIQKYIDDLDLAEGDTVRCSCPDCGGINTFTASKLEGAVMYNCYKLGCKIQGIHTVGMTAADIQARIKNIPKPKPKVEAMVIPQHVVLYGGDGILDDFKDKWDLWDQGLMFDLKDSRAVFPIFYKGIMIDAVGRALRGANPKWLRYSGKANFFIAGTSNTIVVVEDVISAITVAKLGFTGMAILGTSLGDAHMSQLGNYNSIIVALDPDAAHKTLKYRQEIELWTGVRTIALRLDDDIKYRLESDIDSLKEYL